VPRQYWASANAKLTGISKRGNRYLRKIPMHGRTRGREGGTHLTTPKQLTHISALRTSGTRPSVICADSTVFQQPTSTSF